MTAQFSPERSDAIREALIENVDAAPARRRRHVFTASIVIAALAGAGLSSAAFAATDAMRRPVVLPSGAPTPDAQGAVESPPGHMPGQPIFIMLGEPTTHWVEGDTEIPLTDRPDGTNFVSTTMILLGPGVVGFGTKPGASGVSVSYDARDDKEFPEQKWGAFGLDDSTKTEYITATPGTKGVAIIQYQLMVETHLARNARGETYGVEGGPDGTPDLVWVDESAAVKVPGYYRSSEFNAFSPDHPDYPDANRLDELTAERDAKYPNGWDIPLFKSDGVTKVGVYRVDPTP